MNLINVVEGELTFWLKDDNNVSVSLSKTQLAVVCKVLGFEFAETNFTCFSDETLKNLVSMNGNPLRLQDKYKGE